MRNLLLSVLLAIVSKSGCQASDGFGYEVLFEKMEYLDEKIQILQNATIRHEEQLYRENRKTLQFVKDLSEKLIKLQNASNQQQEQLQPKIYEQNSKMLQILNKIYRNVETISSCAQVNKSGRYMLKLMNDVFEVYCEQELYGGGWIVIQNRFDGSAEFYREWTEYRNGFGSLDGEFWLGLQKIYWLTSSKNYELLVHLEDYEGAVKYARYQRFAIGSENEKYVLKTLGTYSGTAGDSLRESVAHKFSTYEQDNDAYKEDNCAKKFHGAWWYWKCSYSNLNANYHFKYQSANDRKAMFWHKFREYRELKISKMMIKEVLIGSE